MSSRSSTLVLLSLAVGSAFVLGTACSSDNNKKGVDGQVKTIDPSSAGAAGESASGGKPSGGSGGAPISAGAAGATSSEGGALVGAAGQTSEGGAAGALGEVCSPIGTATKVTPTVATQTVCKGARIAVSYSSQGTANEFSCCATSDTFTLGNPVIYGTKTEGTAGVLVFDVPADIGYGAKSLSVSCGTSPAAPINLEVTDGNQVAVIDSADDTVPAGAAFALTGQNLDGVTSVVFVDSSPTGGSFDCVITNAATDSLVCDTDQLMPPGTYTVLAQTTDCGFALESPSVTVTVNNQ